MDRLAPLVRRSDPRPGPARLTAIGAAPVEAAALRPDADLAADLRLFAIGWAGGLVFFGTMLA